MHINVRDFLAESSGYSRSYTITGERPVLEGVILVEDITGDITVAKLEAASVLVQGKLNTAVQLECHRCLRTFTRPVQVNLKQIFAVKPGDEEMPIVNREIDLAPLIGQEIILSLPIKLLDRPDCPGLLPKDSSTDASPAPGSLKSRARIIKEER